jgi:hypothetical protein
MELVRLAADRVAGANWNEFRVGQLDPINQQRLAVCALRRQASAWYKTGGRDEEPYGWVRHPENSRFKLERSGFFCYNRSSKSVGWGWLFSGDGAGK